MRVVNAILYFLSGWMPRNRRRVLFGAWLGHRFSDNPKYFLLYLAENHPELELIWCGQGATPVGVPPSVRFIRYGSWASWQVALTAGTCFVSHGFKDVGTFNLLRGARIVYLGHGLAIKHMGAPDLPLSSRLRTAARRLWRLANSFSHAVAISEPHREKLLREYGVQNITADRLLDFGQPRVDFLLHSVARGECESARARLLEVHRLRPARRTITYLPTFRDAQGTAFSFGDVDNKDRARLEALLEEFDAIIIEKGHFADRARSGEPSAGGSSRVCRLGGEVDTQELLLTTDLLITDYSGCYLDYLVLNRPVLHFAYDRKQYENSDRGLYFNLDEVAGGPIIESFQSLLQAIRGALEDPTRDAAGRGRVRERLLSFEQGKANPQLAEFFFGDRSVPG